MTTFLVATLARYVLVEANEEEHAQGLGLVALREVYADLRRKLGCEVPIKIHTVREATRDEIALSNWHDEMVAKEK